MSCIDEPPKPQNRPGLPSLVYRIGDYASFRQRLLSQLTCLVPSPEQAPGVSLARLTTRASDDAAIALLDAFAVTADVLTFYQERIINEAYLRTATERRSVLELARAIGYELSPGVAASTFLAFTVEDTPSAPKVVPVAKGTQILSIPGKNELPQTFETDADIIARVDWNSLQPRLTRPQVITPDTRQLYLSGINTQLQPGDAILLLDEKDSNHPSYLLRLKAVEPLTAAGYTLVKWDESIPDVIAAPPRYPKILAFRQRASLFGSNAPRWEDMPADVKRANGATVKGSVFRWTTDAPSWTFRNAGLPNTDILCLATHGNVLFAGTPIGVFRSTDDGVNWTLANNGLTNFYIQTLHVDELGQVLAGTPGGGLFRSRDDGETWVPIHVGKVLVEKQPNNNFNSINKSLPNTVVRSVLTCTTKGKQGEGIISSIDRNVRGEGTVFRRELTGGNTITVREQRIGDEIVVPEQTKPIQTIFSNLALRVNSSFVSYRLPPGTGFSATSIVPGSPPVSTNVGTISSAGRRVTGVGTQFSVLRQGGNPVITITVNGESKNVTAIDSDTSLTIAESFVREVLEPGTTFFITTPEVRTYLVGTDDGLYRSPDYLPDSEKIWDLQSELSGKIVYSLETDGTHLLAGTNLGIYRSSDQAQTWAFDKNLNRPVFCLATYENGAHWFAGTDDGVYHCSNHGETWTAVNNSNLLKGIKILALAFFQRDTKFHLFAATERGVFHTENHGAQWKQVNAGLTTEDMTALTTKNGAVFAGSRFSGFVEQDWVEFEVPTQPIHLDTLYPKILKDSSIVLLNGNYFEQLQVSNISEEPRKQFLLDAKVTRIVPDRPITEPARFHRRRTIVLAQSEPLKLAEEILTVEAQQTRIFTDPIPGNRVFLKAFVQGLQPEQTLIVSGKHIQAQIETVGGVFRSPKRTKIDPVVWEQSNAGLMNTHVQAIAIARNENRIRILFVGTQEGVFRSLNDGETWEPKSEGLINKTIQTLVSQDRYIIAGTADGIYRSGDGGMMWESANVGLAHRDVRVLVSLQERRENQNQPISILLAGTINGGIFRSENQGKSWTATSLTDTDVQAIARHDTQPDIIFAGTVRDGIFRSMNGGSSWQQIADNTGLSNRNVTALAVITRSGTSYLFAGTAGSGVFRSRNHGDRWEPINTNLTDLEIRCLAVKDNTLWLGTASGGVFRSSNNGNLWEAVSTNLTNTDVRAIFWDEPQGRLFVGGIGILRSPDNLSNVKLRQGDLLQVLSAPSAVPNAPDYQRWQLQDRDGFVGILDTPSLTMLKLLPASPEQPLVSEVAQIRKPPEDRLHPVLELQQPLKYSYDPSTVKIYANVVRASHGETVEEVLGSGDGTAANQRFTLKKPPLTYLSAIHALGAKSTFQVRVNGVLWQEVPSLYPSGERDESYMLRIQDDGTTNVTFGDGVKGARLPSGLENVRATYRSGMGLEGNVRANSLSLLKTRPLGIQEVTNPLPATGGAPRERLDALPARWNAQENEAESAQLLLLNPTGIKLTLASTL